MMISNISSDHVPSSYNFMFNQTSNLYDDQISRPTNMSSGAMSSSSSPDSLDSMTSSSPAMSVTLSPRSMGNLLGISAEEQSENNIDLLDPQPYLIVREQPVDKYRFRYKSEMLGSHGCMSGRSSDKRRKYFPSVELMDYKNPAVIRCSLYTANKNKSERTFHCHRLVIKVDKEEVDDPHEICVDPHAGYIAVFRGMGIIHTAKRHIAEEILRKKRCRLLEMNRARNINVTCLSQNDDVTARTEAELESKTMDLNVVTLCFEAFVYDDNGVPVPICKPVFSEPIRNMKSALTGELKICRIDRHFSTCVGGDEVWILVEKVGKKNIKVKFYEMDEDDNEIWYDFGKFTELDVHHQYAIVLRTPPYRHMDIDEPKHVLVQLFRPSDGSCSEPIKFTYRPSDKFLEGSRKRPRATCDELASLPTNGFNFVIPDAAAGGMYGNSPMLSSVGAVLPEDDDILHDFETMSFNSATLEQALKEDGLDSAEFREFMQHESFEGYLSTYGMLGAPNNMDLTTDSGSSRRRPAALQRALRAKPPGPLPRGPHTPPPRGADAPSPTESGDALPLMSPPAAEEPAREDALMQLVVWRLVQMMTAKPLPTATEVATGIRDLFQKKTDDGDCALHIAMKPNNKCFLDEIMGIIKKSRSIRSETLQLYISDIVNSRNKRLETPLNRAVFYNQPATVSALLRSGAYPNVMDSNGFTPLHIAVANGYSGCLRELLDKINYPEGSGRLCLNIKSEDGFSPLHVAVRNNNSEAVRMLVIAGADVNERDLTDGRTVLHMAIDEDNADIARYLVNRPGMKVNVPDYAGNTALHVACVVGGVGSPELCSILLDAKADPSLANFNMEADDEDATQPVVKLEPVVETDEPEKPRGQTSFDLASDNTEIIKLLQGSVLPKREIKEEPRGDSPPTLPPKEEPSTPKTEFFDSETLSKLCKILNETGGWEQLAQLLDYSSVLVSFSFQSSPSRALFNYADIQGNATVEQIRDCLSMLDETAAVKVIDDMLAKRLATTFS